MNCKPNDLATVVRPTIYDETCTRHTRGVVVQVDCMASPAANDYVYKFMEYVHGPLWRLRWPLQCRGCGGYVTMLPDSVLRPFDPDSAPADDEAQAERPMLHGAKVLTEGSAC